VRPLTSRFRSLLIAIAIFALSATVALAGRPASAGPQPGTGEPQAGASHAPDAAESEAPESEAPESPDPSDGDAGPSASGHPDNHGKLVSEAAQAATPAGFANHGAYVRSIARANHGHAKNAGGKP
jgi:hypothetical protein